MKSLKFLLLLLSPFLLIIFLQSNIQAQSEDENVDYQMVNITSGTTIYTEDTKNIIGSPLILESFEAGRFLFDLKNASKVLPINYDGHKNQVLFIKDDKIQVININSIRGFVFEKPSNFSQTDDVQEVFSLEIRHKKFGFEEPTPVQVLYNQDSGVKLLAIHKISLMKGNSKDPFTGKVTDRYVEFTEYFLQTPDGEMTELRRLRDKDIINVLGKKYKNELKSFMRSNDLDGRSQKDLAKLLAHFESNVYEKP
jgi:hypothetical protein